MYNYIIRHVVTNDGNDKCRCVVCNDNDAGLTMFLKNVNYASMIIDNNNVSEVRVSLYNGKSVINYVRNNVNETFNTIG